MEGNIPKEIIEDIRVRSDIVQVVSQYVQLKRTGKNYKGLCPFHNEKTPSFVVSPDKQLFHCFGCGEGGNVFTFLMRINNLTFPEVCEHLASQVGVTIPENKVQKPEHLKEKEKIKKLNNLVANFYHRTLLKSTKAHDARAYLSKRNLDESIIEKFTLGFAPSSWELLTNFLKKKGFEEKMLLKAGLCSESKRGDKIFDRFRNRIIFPIKDRKGDVLGFGGRVIDEKDEPKYLNSPETPVFNKRETLYGIELSYKELREKNYAIIVEGYMDVIMMHQYGFKNVLAPLGTSFTEKQGRYLKYNTDNVYILFDADAAGEAATIRSLELLQSLGLTIKVCSLLDGMDPDDYLNEYGEENFQQEILDKAESFAYYRLRQAARKKDLNSIEGKKEFVEEAVPVIAKLESNVEQEEYLKLISSWLDIEKETLAREFRRFTTSKSSLYQRKNYVHKNKAENGKRKKTEQYRTNKGQERAEEELLTLMLNSFHDAVPLVKRYLYPEDFSKKEWTFIVHRLFQLESQGEDEVSLSLMLVSSGVDEEKKVSLEKEITRLMTREVPEPLDINKMIRDCVFKIKGEKLEKRKVELQKRLKEMDPREDYEKYREILAELQRYIKMEKTKNIDLEEGG